MEVKKESGKGTILIPKTRSKCNIAPSRQDQLSDLRSDPAPAATITAMRLLNGAPTTIIAIILGIVFSVFGFEFVEKEGFYDKNNCLNEVFINEYVFEFGKNCYVFYGGPLCQMFAEISSIYKKKIRFYKKMCKHNT